MTSKIGIGEEIQEGMVLSIGVSSLEDEYWATIQIEIPDQEEVDSAEFYCLLAGLESATEKIKRIIVELENED